MERRDGQKGKERKCCKEAKEEGQVKKQTRKKKQDCQRGTLCPEERSGTAHTFLSGSAVHLSQRLQITITPLLAPTGKLIS